MIYFLLPILLILFFEVVGQCVFSSLQKEPLTFSFPVGFAAFIAVLYLIGWPISAFNGSFFVYLVLVCFVVLGLIILIIRNRKAIRFVSQPRKTVFFILFLVISVFISYTRTLGDPHGYDTLYYLNMISFNIGNPAMNTLHPHFGTFPNTDIQWITYVFQSYYYFIGCYIYAARSVLSVFGITYETLPAFVWTFQILCQAVFISVSIIVIDEVCKEPVLKATLYLLLILFMGNFYYNNALGFIGNNYRMAYHALATLFLFRYLKTGSKEDRSLFYMIMLGICGLSSTGTFSLILALFGLFFALYDREKSLLKQYALVLSVPILNILIVKLGAHVWIVGTVTLFIGAVVLLNDVILKIYQNKYVRYGTIVLAFLALFALSFRITHNIFDFRAFTYNYSERQDMSWDYFDFSDIRHWIFNLIVLIPMAFYLVKERKHPFAIMSWVLILTVFNPFCCTFVNTVNWVYYRCYDLIINHFTIALFICEMGSILSKTPKMLYSGSLLILSILLSIIQVPRYTNDYFKPGDDYNPIYKIDNSELEIIRNVRTMINDRDIKHPAIITSTFWMPPFIEGSTYLIGKERRYDYNKFSENSYALYLIFFPTDGWDNFRPKDEPPYQKTVELLKESEYDILVVDYGLGGKIDDHYTSFVDLIEGAGYQKTPYSTGAYAVFDLSELKN